MPLRENWAERPERERPIPCDRCKRSTFNNGRICTDCVPSESA